VNRLQKGLHILSWIPLTLIIGVLWAIGLVAVPLALVLSEGDHKDQWPDFLWIWGNDEEQCPDWWYAVAKNKSWFIKTFPAFWWYAMRNVVNNHRFLLDDRDPEVETNWRREWASQPMEASEMRDAGQTMTYKWSWSGPFAGYRRVWLKSSGLYSEFWVGWKVGSGVPGLGFTIQPRFNRVIGA